MLNRPFDPGSAGASARREFERRVAKRDQGLERDRGRFAGIAERLSAEPQSTRAYAKGAEGEVRVARILDESVGEPFVLLRDRAVSGIQGNIDHLVVGDSVVWVIDTKAWTGKVGTRHVGGFFSGSEHLCVKGRDRSQYVDGMGWQVDAVLGALAGAGPLVTIRPALCIEGAEWPWFAKPLVFGDVMVAWPRKLAEMIRSHEIGDVHRRDEVAARLSAKLP